MTTSQLQTFGPDNVQLEVSEISTLEEFFAEYQSKDKVGSPFDHISMINLVSSLETTVFSTLLFETGIACEIPSEVKFQEAIKKCVEIFGSEPNNRNHLIEKVASRLYQRLNQVLKEKLGFAVSKNMASQEKEPENMFQNRDDYYLVRYKGGNEFILPKLDGARYMHFLIRNQGKSFHCSTLFGYVNACTGDEIRSKYSSLSEESDRDEIDKQDGYSNGSVSCDPIMDEKYKNDMQNKLKQLNNELRSAEDAKDFEKKSNIKEVMRFIRKELRGAFTPKWKARNLKDPNDQLRKNIFRVINLTMDKIAKKDPNLYFDLKHDLRCGWYPTYAPTVHVVWLI